MVSISFYVYALFLSAELHWTLNAASCTRPHTKKPPPSISIPDHSRVSDRSHEHAPSGNHPTPARTSCPDHSHDHTPPGDHWSGTQNFGANNPLLHTLKDTKCTNPKFSGSACGCIVWSGHCYLDRDSSGTHFNWTAEVEAGVTVQTGADRLQDFVTWLKANNYQHAHIGEMGTGNDNVGWLTSLNNAMTVMDDNAWEFTYWSAGPWFSGG
jgi:hypothetical protein